LRVEKNVEHQMERSMLVPENALSAKRSIGQRRTLYRERGAPQAREAKIEDDGVRREGRPATLGAVPL
jgi:hypothetical protein